MRDLAVKESYDSEPRCVAGESEVGGYKKNLRPAVNCFLSAPCKGACFSVLPCPCRRCVCVKAFLSCQKSTQAEQDTPILYSTMVAKLQKKMGPEVNCFLFALCKGACFSEL